MTKTMSDPFDEEARTDEVLALMLTKAYLKGATQGFTLGKGRPPRPEEQTAIDRIGDFAFQNFEQILRGSAEGVEDDQATDSVSDQDNSAGSTESTEES